MKSKQEESKPTISTSCEDCIFYNSNECEADRIKTFTKLGRVLENDPHRIHGVCNLKRLADWHHAEQDDALEVATLNVMPLFGIVLFDSTEDDSRVFETIDELMKIDYPENRVRLVISSKSKDRSEKILHAASRLRQKFSDCIVDFHFEENKAEEEYIAFSKLSEATYFVKLEHNANIYHDMFLMINDLINNQLQNAAVFELENNGSIIMKKIVISAYLDYNNYDKMQQGLFEKAKASNLYYFIGNKK